MYAMQIKQFQDWEREADDKEMFQSMAHILTDIRTAIYEQEFKEEVPVSTASPSPLAGALVRKCDDLPLGNSACGAQKRIRGTAGTVIAVPASVDRGNKCPGVTMGTAIAGGAAPSGATVQPTAGGAAPSGATPHAVWEWQPGSPQKAKDSFRIQRHAAMSRALADYRDHRGRGWEEVLVRCLARVRGTRLSTSSSPEPRRRMPHQEAHPPKGGRRTLTALAR